jgi:CRISPR-associated protein Cas5d
LFADDPSTRTQRNTVALSDVDYIIEGRCHLTDKAGRDDSLTKFTEMFQRRVAKGQHFHQPYLGCREIVAEGLSADNAPPPIADDRDVGVMLWDIAFGSVNSAIFFYASLRSGTLEVPMHAEAALATLGMQGGEA